MSLDEAAAPAGAGEARLLKVSLAGTIVVAAGGMLCGLLSGSISILFEGLFSLIDAVITATALHVARLVAREADRRFQFGYWHFEPLVLALNSCVLMLLCVYAFFNAVLGLIAGGHEVEFDIAFFYTGAISALCIAMYVYQRRGNVEVRSEFVRLDIHGWLMSAAITGALLLAFTAAVAMRGTKLEFAVPFVDPAVLALLAPFLMLAPIAAAKRAFREIFMMAPRALDSEVRTAMDEIVRRRGFTGYSSYIAKVGRADFVEISVVLPPGYPLLAVERLDELRREIEAALGGANKDRWLTIMFTADAGTARARLGSLTAP
jgi:predicted Co/Zn/Cd cation transporter (cation efflux family)